MDDDAAGCIAWGLAALIILVGIIAVFDVLRTW